MQSACLLACFFVEGLLLSVWYSSFVESAYVCGIDAEWRPNLATATATLLQLAFTGTANNQQESFVLLLVSCAYSAG